MPRNLDTICLKCLSKEPHRRYATAHLLAEDLERFLDGRPVVARPISRTVRLLRWCRRNPPVATLAALVVLLLLGGSVASSTLAVLANRNAAQAQHQRDRSAIQIECTKEAGLYAALVSPFRCSVIAAVNQKVTTSVTIQIANSDVAAKSVAVMRGQELLWYGYFPIQKSILTRWSLSRSGIDGIAGAEGTGVAQDKSNNDPRNTSITHDKLNCIS